MSHNAINIMMDEIASVEAGYPLRSSSRGLIAGDCALLQLRHVQPGGGLDWAAVPKVALPSKRSIRYLESGDVLFASRGTRNFAYAISNISHKAVAAPEFYVLKVLNNSSLSIYPPSKLSRLL